MTDLSDADLVEQFARNHCEAAFAVLVQRYVNLVYSTALRQTGNPQNAEDVTQAVFIIFARKANSLGNKTVLPGWLHRTARLTAANCQRSEMRRINREHEAFVRSSIQNEPSSDLIWAELSPLLDNAVESLNESDRNAVLLRFFENKSLLEVGAALHLEESAAQKRISRALEKLRKFFKKRGVVLSVAAIAGAISANSVQAAPMGLPVAITTVVANETLISATLTSAIEGTMKLMLWMKIKYAMAFGAASLLLVGVVAAAGYQKSNKAEALKFLSAVQAKYDSFQSYACSGKVILDNRGEKTTVPFNILLKRPDWYRIDWHPQGMTESNSIWSVGRGNYLLTSTGFLGRTNKFITMPDRRIGIASPGFNVPRTIPTIFFEKEWGNTLTGLTKSTNLTKKADEKLEGVICAVLEGNTGQSVTTLWIGKSDLLIRKRQESIPPPAMDPVYEKTLLDVLARTTTAINREKSKSPTTQQAAAKQAQDIQKMQNEIKQMKQEAARIHLPVIITELHENVIANDVLNPEDFVPVIPENLKPVDWATISKPVSQIK